MFVFVSLFDRSINDRGFPYTIPNTMIDNIKLGQVVKVPFGDEEHFGVVLEITDNVDISLEKIKDINEIVIKEALLNNEQLSLLSHVSSHYYSQVHNVLSSFMPKNMRDKIKKGKFKIETKREFNYSADLKKTLTGEQNKTFQKIKESNISLLYGVTGSGKTEIYVNLIKEELEKGGSCLLLVPEIILTSQLQNYIMEVFGKDVLVVNSSVTEAQKTKNRIDIYLGKARLVIGTRSSIFYPYQDLSLVIVDEEHDDSYISGESPRYDSIELLEYYSHLIGFNLLLGSGTPKVSHVHNFLSKGYNFVNLTEEIKKS